MNDKEYFKNLKEEDYIAWDSLVNDPMVKGSGDSGYIFSIVLVIVIFCFIVYCFF